jgi:hypothetical protein
MYLGLRPLNFAKALARGQEDRGHILWDILKTVATNAIREVI